MRRLIDFACARETLAGTLDEAPGATGLLIVSGGNEIRIGAHRGMAMLAARLAARGIPVFRFDRRGIGDSTGENGGYASSAPDIAAAAAAFRGAAPHVTRIAGFGICDAATALALFGAAAGVDRLILANPWVVETDDELPPTAAIRARYAERLRDPRQWLRAVKGDVDFKKFLSGLRKLSVSENEQSTELGQRVFAALPQSATVVLASGDATAQAFADAAARHGWDGTARAIPTDSHSFARMGDDDALIEAIVAAIG